MDFVYTLMDLGLVPIITVGIVLFLLYKGLGFGKKNNSNNGGGSNNNNSTPPPQNPPSPPAS